MEDSFPWTGGREASFKMIQADRIYFELYFKSNTAADKTGSTSPRAGITDPCSRLRTPVLERKHTEMMKN